MENFMHIPLEVKRYPESWFSFPQSFVVPQGWLYRTDTDGRYRYAAHEVVVDLSCAGDWLEMVDDEEKQRIRHEIY